MRSALFRTKQRTNTITINLIYTCPRSRARTINRHPVCHVSNLIIQFVVPICALPGSFSLRHRTSSLYPENRGNAKDTISSTISCISNIYTERLFTVSQCALSVLSPSNVTRTILLNKLNYTFLTYNTYKSNQIMFSAKIVLEEGSRSLIRPIFRL